MPPKVGSILACVGIQLGEFDVEHVDSCELLEQARLALHDRLAGQRADIPKAEHRGAVGDDGHEIAARRQHIRLQFVLGNDQARLCHAGRIRQRQIALRCHGRGRHDRDLPRCRQAMIFERGFPQILIHRDPRLGVFALEAAAAATPQPRERRQPCRHFDHDFAPATMADARVARRSRRARDRRPGAASPS
jgi:hypothetical protein